MEVEEVGEVGQAAVVEEEGYGGGGTSGRSPPRLIDASARTSLGLSSPRNGFPTRKRRKSVRGSAIRAHPLNTVEPDMVRRGCIRWTASSMSSFTSKVASRRKSVKLRIR